jgi:L-asparagine transporter-like permease
MNNPFLRYLLTTLLFSFILGAGGFLFSIIIPSVAILPTFYFIILYFFFVTVVFHFGLLQSMKGKPQGFVRYFMGATTFKLLIHLAVVIIYAILHREQALPFLLSFFVLYILFMVYEVLVVMKLNKQQPN